MVIKVIRQNDKDAIDQFGNVFEIKEDSRGMNDKFWIEKKGGDFKDSFLIKFSTRHPDKMSELNIYNEIICSKICAGLGLDHVNYELCEFTDSDGSVKYGVISQNYKNSPSDIEINGKSLHESYCDWYYDNNFGQIPDVELNTVYNYVEELKVRFHSQQMNMSPETETRLTEELLELALFDFCICQIDRHWKNVGWIHNNILDDNNFEIKLLPIYDNECGFLLDDITEEKLQNLLFNIRTPKKVQNAIDMLNSKRVNSPYLGIKTSLVRIKENSNGFLVPVSNIEENVSNATIEARELAEEINNRPRFKKLYDNIINFDIDKLLDELDFIPESQSYLKEVYSFVWKTRVGLLTQSMNKMKGNGEGEKYNGKSLS